MKIDKTKLHYIWYEDQDGNKIIQNDSLVIADTEFDKNKVYTYHVKFPFTLKETIDIYNPYAKGKKPKFKRLMTGESSWNEQVVLAMANSGDYTLCQAIYIYASACERCINVLWNKYIGPNEGYSEDSEHYRTCGTVCEFCKND